MYTYVFFSPFTTETTESLLGIKVSVELSTEGLAVESLDVWLMVFCFVLSYYRPHFSHFFDRFQSQVLENRISCNRDI